VSTIEKKNPVLACARSRVRSLSRSLAPIFMRENLDALTAAILIETKAQRRLTDFMLGHAMPV
jgi:hypothetical protein